MGQHYIPQYYLRGFCQDSDRMIWVYDMKEERIFSANVSKIANVCNFYPTELEDYLSQKIEGPANTVIKKIRDREDITPAEKSELAKYISVLWKRVPKGLNRIMLRAPKISNELRQKMHSELDREIAYNPAKADVLENRKLKIDRILEKNPQEFHTDVWHEMIRAEQTPRIIEAVNSMTWRFFYFDEYPAFTTCDSPVFIFEDIGVGHPESELSFPISSNVVLWATRRKNGSESYLQGTKPIIREMNRRTASMAVRYVFHSKKEKWLSSFLAKKEWRLNKIQ